jgi:hypothetical protein
VVAPLVAPDPAEDPLAASPLEVPDAIAEPLEAMPLASGVEEPLAD